MHGGYYIKGDSAAARCMFDVSPAYIRAKRLQFSGLAMVRVESVDKHQSRLIAGSATVVGIICL